MAKRMQEQKAEERIVAKSNATATNLSSHVPTSSSSAKSPIASKSPSYSETWELDKKKFKIRRRVEFSSATARCMPWRVDWHSNGKPVATKEESGDVDHSESETGSEEDVTRKPFAYETAKEKRYASSKSDHPGSSKAERKEWSHNLYMSPATVHHMDAVFSIVRKIYQREPDDPMDDLDVNMAIWGIFLNTSLQAAVHLGRLWGESTIREESSLEQCGTVIQWNWKTDQWTNRNHWCEHH